MRYLTATAVLTLYGAAIAETWTVDDDGAADFDNIQAAAGGLIYMVECPVFQIDA